MSKQEPTKVVHLRLPVSMIAWLKQESKLEYRKLSGTIRKIVEHYKSQKAA